MSELRKFETESTDPNPAERAVFSLRLCRVSQQTKHVLRSSSEILHALRRLRQCLLNCDICPALEQCELREHFNLQIDMVIAEINEEWGW